ncbi:MAG TPA: TlpA disulfide reductase family protein [Puia sp.]|nr:TlpA disulfide reductase family protein [Puia sp.]
MKFIFLLMLLGVFCPSQSSYAQAKPIYLDGQVVHEGKRRSTITVVVWKDVIASNIGATQMTCTTGRNGSFSFKLPRIEHPMRIGFEVNQSKGGNSVLNYYILEPDDHIQMKINWTPKGFQYRFFGIGATKYRCRQEIDMASNKLEPFIEQEKNKPIFYEPIYSLRRIQLEDSILQIKFSILDKYKLSRPVYHMLKSDIIGETRITFQCFFMVQQYLADSMKKERLLQYYRSMLMLPVDTSSYSTISPAYLNFLFSRSAICLFVESNGNAEYILANVYNARFKELYDKLKADYRGELRERMLLNYLTDMRIQDTRGDFDSCLQDAYELVHNPYLKEILKKWRTVKLKGTPVYDFSLPDTTGKMVRLSDLRGKLVFIDIWFTGCSGCKLFARQMDSLVYPLFKNDSNIQFVSICTDLKKSQWLKSVREEKYSLKTFINLYTNGLGMEHPFLKYYDVEGGPTLMLVDKKGRIYSVTVPRDGKSKELIALIYAALRESDH